MEIFFFNRKSLNTFIDIENKTEEEWLQDIYSAITRQKKATVHPTDNLLISLQLSNDEPKAAMIVFEPQFWAEPIGFKVRTTKKIMNTVWKYPAFKGMQQISISKLKDDYEYGIKIFNHNIKPKVPFIMGVIFEETGDPISFVAEVLLWNGENGENGEQSIGFSNFK